MQRKLMVIRALSVTVARRALFFLTITGGLILLTLFVIIWALASFISSWWWLLLIIYLPLLLVAIALRAVAGFLASQLYPRPLSKRQRGQLKSFVDKLQRLLETRGLGWPLFALLNIKDLLLYRELRTMQQLLSDTTSLKRDFAQLEKVLQS